MLHVKETVWDIEFKVHVWILMFLYEPLIKGTILYTALTKNSYSRHHNLLLLVSKDLKFWRNSGAFPIG